MRANQAVPVTKQLEAALSQLRAKSTKRDRANLARFGITTDQFIGVSMSNMKVIAKQFGRNHDLALGLWQSGWYEARMLATLVDDPAQVSTDQMDQWCGEFDNWAICDTACFALFDRTPYAWRKVDEWSRSPREFVRRAAFALIWSLSVHDKKSDDAVFHRGLKLIEQAATDERDLVKKAVNMALRAVGKRNSALNEAAAKTAERLAASADSTARWVGKHALRELTSAAVRRRLKSRATAR